MNQCKFFINQQNYFFINNYFNDVRNYIAKRTYLIGGLTFDKPNTFGLFILNKMNNSTLSFEYSTNIYLQLKTVNQFSAYCNALNKLIIRKRAII